MTRHKTPGFRLCCSAAALTLLLAGCATTDSGTSPGRPATPSGTLTTGSAVITPAPTQPAASIRQTQTCNAKPVQLYIGHNTVPSTLEMIRKKAGAYSVRVLAENQPSTMEFDQERLNVIANDAGKITALRCG